MLIPAALLLLSVSFALSFAAEDVDTLLSAPKALPDELPLAVVWEDSLSTTDVVSLTTPVSLSVPVATDFLVVNTTIPSSITEKLALIIIFLYLKRIINLT